MTKLALLCDARAINGHQAKHLQKVLETAGLHVMLAESCQAVEELLAAAQVPIERITPTAYDVKRMVERADAVLALPKRSRDLFGSRNPLWQGVRHAHRMNKKTHIVY
jgi:hypothetical protein